MSTSQLQITCIGHTECLGATIVIWEDMAKDEGKHFGIPTKLDHALKHITLRCPYYDSSSRERAMAQAELQERSLSKKKGLNHASSVMPDIPASNSCVAHICLIGN